MFIIIIFFNLLISFQEKLNTSIKSLATYLRSACISRPSPEGTWSLVADSRAFCSPFRPFPAELPGPGGSHVPAFLPTPGFRFLNSGLSSYLESWSPLPDLSPILSPIFSYPHSGLQLLPAHLRCSCLQALPLKSFINNFPGKVCPKRSSGAFAPQAWSLVCLNFAPGTTLVIQLRRVWLSSPVF